MGQKVNPNGLRYGINKNWQSRWIAKDEKQVAKWIIEDEKIRNYFIKQYAQSQVVRTEIERTQTRIDVYVYVGQPGVVLGKESENLPKIKLAINKIVGRNIKVNLTVMPVEVTALSARIIAREIADAIENRVSFRVAQKMAIRKAMFNHAKGIKTRVSGRLGGVEMAREEGYSEGVIPLSTLRADIDYALEEAHTTYGIIGVKVWINRGEIFGTNLQKVAAQQNTRKPNRPRFNNNRNGRFEGKKNSFIRSSNSQVGEKTDTNKAEASK